MTRQTALQTRLQTRKSWHRITPERETPSSLADNRGRDAQRSCSFISLLLTTWRFQEDPLVQPEEAAVWELAARPEISAMWTESRPEDGGGPHSHNNHSHFSLERFHPLIKAAKTLLDPADPLIFPGLTPAGPSDEDSEPGQGRE